MCNIHISFEANNHDSDGSIASQGSRGESSNLESIIDVVRVRVIHQSGQKIRVKYLES